MRQETLGRSLAHRTVQQKRPLVAIVLTQTSERAGQVTDTVVATNIMPIQSTQQQQQQQKQQQKQ